MIQCRLFMCGAVIAVVIVFIAIGGVTVSVMSYFKLQRHRADAVAMASYRKLAEESVTRQQELREELANVTARLTAVENLLRSG